MGDVPGPSVDAGSAGDLSSRPVALSTAVLSCAAPPSGKLLRNRKYPVDYLGHAHGLPFPHNAAEGYPRAARRTKTVGVDQALTKSSAER